MALRKVKDFYRLTSLSRKALIFYEKKGLLTPARRDRDTGYRYYSDEQIKTAARIAFLKNFGIPLRGISDIINDRVSFKQYLENSRIRLNLIRTRANADNALKAIDISEKDENFLSMTPIIRYMNETPVLYIEARCRLRDVSLYHSLLSRFVISNAIHITGNPFTVFLSDYSDNLAHIKVCRPVQNHVEMYHEDIKWELQPGRRIAVLRSFGKYELLPPAYARLVAYLLEKKMDLSGEYLETYLISGDSRNMDESSFITDIAAVLL